LKKKAGTAQCPLCIANRLWRERMNERIAQLVDNCKKSMRCGYFQHCDPCARLRQARFADKAERLFPNIKDLYLFRITPDDNTQAEIVRLKAAVKRQLKGGVALWTVEQGQVTNKLHLNVIAGINHQRPFKAASHFVTGPIKCLRTTAAYILKKDQYPSPDYYNSTQFGTFNNFETIAMNANMLPTLQAAALDMHLYHLQKLPTPYLERQDLIAKQRIQHGDYKAVAMNNLPRFRDAIARLKGSIK
jgi:hypothetical protein